MLALHAKSSSDCSSSSENTELHQAAAGTNPCCRRSKHWGCGSPQSWKEKVRTAGGCCAHHVCAGNYPALVWHILQLWQPCGVSEVVYSHQDVPCTHHLAQHLLWQATEKGGCILRSEQQFPKLFPEFPPLLPSAPLRRVTRGLHQDHFPHDGPSGLSNRAQKDPWPQRAKSPPKRTTSRACPQTNPTCSGLRLPVSIRSKAPSPAWSLAR